ncbi:MAG: tripartite tricarboxylate transporter substrate binding protein, partial [Betaproteobacteria bacterium]|nr:tripartite tricarboxylate transporter substrate binding protein [Betaproteobacteria bacterium]
EMVHVPYKGGGPSTIALMSGEAQAVIGTIGSYYPHIKAGRVRPVAVTSAERVKQFPDVPAIAETIPGYDFVAWVGSFAPAGMPRAIVKKLNAEIHKVLRDPEVAATLTKMTLDPMFMTPEEFDQRLRADYDKYGRLVKLAGVQAD